MFNSYWNDGNFGWVWFIWMGVVILAFSSFGNWGYTYRIHRRYGALTRRDALDILNERYAGGEITQPDYTRMRSEIAATAVQAR